MPYYNTNATIIYNAAIMIQRKSLSYLSAKIYQRKGNHISQFEASNAFAMTSAFLAVTMRR